MSVEHINHRADSDAESAIKLASIILQNIFIYYVVCMYKFIREEKIHMQSIKYSWKILWYEPQKLTNVL